MTDIAIRVLDQRGAGVPLFDFVQGGLDLLTDDGLETAVLISLFSDARAPADAELPDGSRDPRGWWGDTHPSTAEDELGSLLWLLHRQKITQSLLIRAEDYAAVALQWLRDDDVASEVDVSAERYDISGMALAVTITRADGRRWAARWVAQLGA